MESAADHGTEKPGAGYHGLHGVTVKCQAATEKVATLVNSSGDFEISIGIV